ncbi:tautomerase family protein [Shinella sp. BYT-45]|uniref:tautomerase family protein n=1 Tax=Shinella sp. BYT-45 TaxID=3377377 RepID=UPI003980DA8C
MPFLHIRISGRSLDDAERLHLQDEATRLAVTLLGKRAEATAVLVEEQAIAGWTVGARRLPAAGYLEVLVSEGTNTAEEKERFIAAAYGLLEEAVGVPLNPVTYVVVREVKMDSWGYGGRTQENRRIAAAA